MINDGMLLIIVTNYDFTLTYIFLSFYLLFYNLTWPVPMESKLSVMNESLIFGKIKYVKDEIVHRSSLNTN